MTKKPNEKTAPKDPVVANNLKAQIYDLLVEIEQLQREIQSRQQRVQQLNAEIAKNK